MNLKWEAHEYTRILKLDVDNVLGDAVSCVPVLIIIYHFLNIFSQQSLLLTIQQWSSVIL